MAHYELYPDVKTPKSSSFRETVLLSGERPGGRRDPRGGAAPPLRPRAARPPSAASLVIHRRRCAIGQRLIRPFLVVEAEVAAQPHPRLARGGVLVQVHLLIFDRPPQPFGKDVVQRPPPPIHADLHPGHRQPVRVLRTGEMTPLIAVPDLGRGHR